tara:strand:- start:68 stop:283 length:216 start_codon:yes stop_codon:yes gene_type:complete
MKYANIMQNHLNRLDSGLLKLNGLIKAGKQQEALKFMEEDLKELFDNLQTTINLSKTGNIGASGLQNISAL